MTINNDKFFFYSKSRDVLPGKGTHEFVNDISLYPELSVIHNWRKVLSNFHVSPFQYDGFTYNSIEHVFQAKKNELVDRDKAFLFTIESGSEIGLGDGSVARKNRKICLLNNEQLRLWNDIKDNIMYEASLAKYSSCYGAKCILKDTKNAELWHIVSRSRPIRFFHLEQIRSLI